MNVEATPKTATKTIQQISQVLDVICTLMIITIPLWTIWTWAISDQATLASNAQISTEAIKGTIQSWQRLCGAFIALVPALFEVIALLQAKRCFRLFADGQVFVGTAVRYMKNFAGWTLASFVVGAIAMSAHSVILTMGNPTGERVLKFGVTVDFGTVMYLGIVWLMAAVIGYGQTIAEENANFV